MDTIRRTAFVAAVLLLLPAAAHADRHFADMLMAYFKAKGSDYDGFQLSGSWPILACHDISLVGSFGRYNGKESDDPNDHSVRTYVLGLRYTHHWKTGNIEWLPFLQVLGGPVDNIRKVDDELSQVATHKAIVVGAGIQPGRYGKAGLRARIQVDYFYRSYEDLGPTRPGGNGIAVSIGVMYQFGPEWPHDKCHDGDPLPCPTTPSEKPSARLVPADLRGPLEPGARYAGTPSSP